jgi:hypothetical protein
MCCPEGQRIADMAGDALAQGGSTSYKLKLISKSRFFARNIFA